MLTTAGSKSKVFRYTLLTFDIIFRRLLQALPYSLSMCDPTVLYDSKHCALINDRKATGGAMLC